MATNKKSFILYCDLIHTVDLLDDSSSGKLFKHLLAYVNDRNPVVEDMVLKLVFEPIKQQLKRDLTDWESTRKKRSDAGRKGGLTKSKSRDNKK